MARDLTPFTDDRICYLRKLAAFWRRQSDAYATQENPDLQSAQACLNEWARTDIEISLELGRRQ